MTHSRYLGIASLFAGMCMVPLFAAAQSADDLKAQIQAILAEIAALQGKIKSSPTQPMQPQSSSQSNSDGRTCPIFSRSLSLGSQGDDVRALQQFLIEQNFANAGSATGSFDMRTQIAVQAWQAQVGIVSSGDPESTGWGVVGRRTQSLIKLNCSAASSSSHLGRCPIALPPLSICSTTWQPVRDAYGCTNSYRCSFPLPQAATTSSNVATSSPPVISTGVVSTGSCVTPWGNVIKANGDSVRYVPYFTGGVNVTGSNPNVLCQKGNWVVQAQ